MYSAVQEAHSASQPPVVWLEPNMKVLSPPLQQFHRSAASVAQTHKNNGLLQTFEEGGYGEAAYSGTCSGATVRYCSAPFDLCVGHRSSAIM